MYIYMFVAIVFLFFKQSSQLPCAWYCLFVVYFSLFDSLISISNRMFRSLFDGASLPPQTITYGFFPLSPFSFDFPKLMCYSTRERTSVCSTAILSIWSDDTWNSNERFYEGKRREEKKEIEHNISDSKDFHSFFWK